jgi:hypothetical protein
MANAACQRTAYAVSRDIAGGYILSVMRNYATGTLRVAGRMNAAKRQASSPVSFSKLAPADDAFQ